MEPERAVKRRQVPTLTLELKTLDGGETWKSETAPLFGSVSSAKFSEPDAITGLSIQPVVSNGRLRSIHMDGRTGKVNSVYRANLRVMDAPVPGSRSFPRRSGTSRET